MTDVILPVPGAPRKWAKEEATEGTCLRQDGQRHIAWVTNLGWSVMTHSPIPGQEAMGWGGGEALH